MSSYRFGAQPKYYPANWDGYGHASTRAASRRSLGNLDWEEAGGGLPYPPLVGNDCHPDPTRMYALQPLVLSPNNPLSGWPPVRPSGVEPLGLSDSEKKYVMLGGAALAAWYLLKKKKRR